MYRKLFFSLTILTLFNALIFANKIDSINTSLENLGGNEKLEALHEASYSLASSHPQEAKLFARELITLTKKDQFRYKALAYYDLGEAYYYLELYNEALDNYLLAEPYLILINDSSRLAENYSNIGLIHLYKANYEQSISYYNKSLKIETELNNSSGMAKSLQNMGLIFGNLKKYEMQGHYFMQALQIYKKLNDQRSIADISLNLGVSFIRQNNPRSAYSYYIKALKEYTSLKDSSRIASIYTNLGYYNINEHQHDSSFYYFSLALDIFTKRNEKSGLIHTYTGLGDLMVAQNKKKEAIKMYLKCEEINKTVGLTNTQCDNLYSLYETFKKLDDFENALRTLENYQLIKDSIYNDEQSSAILELENKYLFQKSQNEVTSLKAKNRLYAIFFISLLGIIFLGGSFIAYYNRNKRLIAKQRLLQLEQKVLRTQMNPHFIFNSLSAIQCYILENKTLDAVDFLADFAGLMRMVLQYSQDEYITLEQERKILEHYINLQNRRFGDKIKYKIIIDERLEKTKTMIPPMLAQPFIENSFEHGELCKRENGSITVRFEKKFKHLSFCIEDNGIGISHHTEKKEKNNKVHKSLAMKITKERLKIINHSQLTNKVGLCVENRSKYGEEGTRVEFTIPLVEMN